MKIGIIGGGVIGLTCGVVLAESGHDVTLFSRDPFERTTSYAAGAICYPYGVEQSKRVIRWFKETQAILDSLKDNAEVGIFDARWRKLSIAEEFEPPFWFNEVRGARFLESGDPLLPASFRSGIAADVLIMAVDKYFPWLQRRFIAAGGCMEMRHVETPHSLGQSYGALINATGIGAHHFSKDKTVYPARGQVVVVKNKDIRTHTALQEGTFYLYPRGEQCLLGGSFDVDAWDLTPDDSLTARILEWAGRIEPALKGAEVLSVRTGLRPMRETVRLEREILEDGTLLIHNYGHGGAGYTMSWGCAFEVLKMLENE